MFRRVAEVLAEIEEFHEAIRGLVPEEGISDNGPLVLRELTERADFVNEATDAKHPKEITTVEGSSTSSSAHVGTEPPLPSKRRQRGDSHTDPPNV